VPTDVPSDDEIKELVAHGKHNARTSTLVQAWCENARIQRSGGVGVVEQVYNVPIGHMGINCAHAKRTGMMSWDLRDAFFTHYEASCKSCTQRVPGKGKDIQPEIDQYENAKAERIRRQQDEKRQRLIAASERQSIRAELFDQSDPIQVEILQLLDTIDSDSDSTEQEHRLYELGKLAPQYFTDSVVEYLVSEVDEQQSSICYVAADLLLEIPISPNVKRKVAVKACAYHHSKSVLQWLQSNMSELSDVEMREILWTITLIAAPPRTLLDPSPDSNCEPLYALAEAHPDFLQQEIQFLLKEKNKTKQVVLATNIVWVVAAKYPDIVTPFAKDILALLLRNHLLLPEFARDGDDLTIKRLTETSGIYFGRDPEGCDTYITALVQAGNYSVGVEAAHIYVEALKEEWKGPNLEPTPANTLAFKRVLEIAVRNGHSFHPAVEYFSYPREQIAEIASAEMENLFGNAALLTQEIEAISDEPIVATLQTGFAALEADRKRSTLDRLQSDLIKWVVLASKHRQSEGLHQVLDLLEKTPDEPAFFKANVIESISNLVSDTQSLNAVLPYLFNGLTHREPLVRAATARAIEEVHYSFYKDFPDLLFEMLSVLLRDPKIVVHKNAVRCIDSCIRYFPKNTKMEVMLSLMILLRAYVNDNNGEHYFVGDCLHILVEDLATDTELEGEFGQYIVSLLTRLEDYSACHAIERTYHGLGNTVGFSTVVINCLDSEAAQITDGKSLYRVLFTMPVDSLKACTDEIAEIGIKYARQYPYQSTLCISLLSRAQAFALANETCGKIVDKLPDDVEHTALREHFKSLKTIAQFEANLPALTLKPIKAWLDSIDSDFLESSPDDSSDDIDSYLDELEAGNNPKHSEPVFQCFITRVLSLQAIESRDVDTLNRCSEKINHLAGRYIGYLPYRELEAFSTALKCFALQVKWLGATLNAELESLRFQTAAKMHANSYLSEVKNLNPTVFDAVIDHIGKATTPDDIDQGAQTLLSIPMPFSEKTRWYSGNYRSFDGTPSVPVRPEIAFVKFDINGKSAKSIDSLAPNVLHDLELHVRVSNWPDKAERLLIQPVSIEPMDSYQLPQFDIPRPENTHDHTFRHKDRIILKYPQPLGAKPLEFKFRSVFEPNDSGHVDLVGHRTLKLQSLNPTGNAISGYDNVDTKILSIRNELLQFISNEDLASLITILSVLGNISGQAVQDRLYPAGMTEPQFQPQLRRLLRSDYRIGAELEEHPASAGGYTDLSFRRIAIELKAEPMTFTPARNEKYRQQTAQYAVGFLKRVGVLCVLDSRQKATPPLPLDDLITVHKLTDPEGVFIVQVVIQGGITLPSDLSK